jgi:hypothetical protein
VQIAVEGDPARKSHDRQNPSAPEIRTPLAPKLFRVQALVSIPAKRQARKAFHTTVRRGCRMLVILCAGTDSGSSPMRGFTPEVPLAVFSTFSNDIAHFDSIALQNDIDSEDLNFRGPLQIAVC